MGELELRSQALDHSDPRLFVKPFIHTGKSMLEALTFPVASHCVLGCGRPRFLHSCFLVFLVELCISRFPSHGDKDTLAGAHRRNDVWCLTVLQHTVRHGGKARHPGCCSACDSKSCEAICHISGLSREAGRGELQERPWRCWE